MNDIQAHDQTWPGHDDAHPGGDEVGEAKITAAKDKLLEAKGAASDAADGLREKIARNPVTSVGLAAGVGLLIGLVLLRPRS
ncbi:MAG: hypothetical protein JSR77_12940 [Planctomycetes bacterium]|nr:hypothetical protein [Planctomycetota bacterium]